MLIANQAVHISWGLKLSVGYNGTKKIEYILHCSFLILRHFSARMSSTEVSIPAYHGREQEHDDI